MTVDLATSRSFFSFGDFASSTFGLEAPVVEQALPRIVVASQRMGQMASLELHGLTAESIEWFNNGVSTGQTGATYMLPMGGIITAVVTDGGMPYTTPILRVLHAHDDDSHNASDNALVALVPHQSATHIAATDGPWSEATTWDVGTVPEAGSQVLIPEGRAVTYDSAIAPRLDRIRVDGTLDWALDRSTNMLVETIIVTPSGTLQIGNAVDDRLPLAHRATVTISNRAYGIDPDHPTDLDLANDPTLIGRGIVALGKWAAFGFHRETHVKTASLNLPMTGGTSVTLDHAPDGWQVGDRIVIPGTAVDLDLNGVNTRYDEERIITGIAGSVVSFNDALIHNHDNHNPAFAERDEFRLPILNTERNIIVTSEAGAAVHQRGHTMVMHGASMLDLWDVGFHRLGRTDKSMSAGLVEDGQLRRLALNATKASDKELVPLTADANLQSRYPIHGHFMGFNRSETPLVRDCYIEDAKGWGGVHHGCRMDWIGNVIYRFQGSGFVAETGNELGRWSDMVVVGLETVTGAYRFPKGQEEVYGKGGDMGRWGYGFFYRGRAMIVTTCIAVGTTWGHVFYHRGGALNTTAGKIELIRTDLDVNDLNLNNGEATINVEDYPISHFHACGSIGCAGAMAVVKSAAAQGHDLNIKIAEFVGWAVGRGLGLNYIGGYLVQDVLVAASDFASQVDYGNNEGASTGKTNQVAFDRFEAVGFTVGIEIQGADVQGIANSNFSQDDDPRFIIGNVTLDTCTTDIRYTSATGSAVLVEDVTKIMPQPTTYASRPSVALPFITGEKSGNQLLNPATAIKTDTVSFGAIIPKVWDGNILRFGNNPQIAPRELALTYGVWDYTDGDGTHKIVLYTNYWSDRLTAMSIKTMNAIKWIGELPSGTVENGAWTRSAADPVCADVTRSVVSDVEDSFNVLDNATGETGTTLSLNIPEFETGLGTDKPAHFKANYGFITVSKGGLVTYRSVPGFVGDDRMLVYVYDGMGRFCTVEITYNVTEA